MLDSKIKTFWIINQYASTPDRGMGGRHYYMAREMVKRGYRVCIIAASYTHLLYKPVKLEKAYVTEIIDGIEYVWIRTNVYRYAHDKRRIFNWFQFLFKLARLPKIIPNKPDTILVSSPSLLSYLGAEWLAKRLKARLVFEVRDIWPLTLMELGGVSSKHPFIRLLQWVEDRAYRIADHVISTLPNAILHMQTRGLQVSKFTWIGNGFSQEELAHPQPLSINVLNKLPTEHFVVGYAGTIGLANALDPLLDAAGLLQLEGSNVSFVLMGKGKEKVRLQQRVIDQGLKNVTFLDPIPKNQVQNFLKALDVCYMGAPDSKLYKYGVSPNKLFDYLYSKKLIIYAINSGDYNPVEEAGAGISVPAEDASAIAKAITRLHGLSAVERETMGDKGRAYVVEKYEYGILADNLIRILNGDQTQ